MVDGVAAAGLELRRPAPCRRKGHLLGHEAAPTRGTRSAGSRRRLQADRDAEEQRDRVRHRVLCRRHRICADLAHLVDGGAGPGRRVRRAARVRVPPRRGRRDTRRADRSVRTATSSGDRPMNVAVVLDEVHRAPASAGDSGPAPKRVVVAYGFWIFLLSDIVMFAALFASYAVLVRGTAGGPTG